MNDLISRAAAIDALTDTELRRNLDSVYDGDMNRTRRAAQRVIAQLPAVDAIPVEWLQRRRDIYLKAYHAGHESEIHTAAILNDTLMAWQKEQEAANETGRP